MSFELNCKSTCRHSILFFFYCILFTVNDGALVQVVVIATFLKMQITEAANIDTTKDGYEGNLLHGSFLSG